MSCPVNGLFEIRVVEDDGWTLSTELESDVLEVTLGSCLHDLPANEGGTGEGDLLDTAVLADGLANALSVSDDEVEDSRREAGFVDHLGHHESGEGSELGGLHNDGVSGGESGADLPAYHQDYGGRRVK